MGSKVTRYGHGAWPEDDWGPMPDGPYVRFEDHAALEAEVERLTKRGSFLDSMWKNALDEVGVQRAEVERLNGLLDEIEDAHLATIERMRGLLEDCRVSLKEADELVFCDTYDCELVARIDAELKERE